MSDINSFIHISGILRNFASYFNWGHFTTFENSFCLKNNTAVSRKISQMRELLVVKG